MYRDGYPIRVEVTPHRIDGITQRAPIRMQTNLKPLFRLQSLKTPVHLENNPQVIELLGQRAPIIK